MKWNKEFHLNQFIIVSLQLKIYCVLPNICYKEKAQKEIKRETLHVIVGFENDRQSFQMDILLLRV